MYRTSVLCLAPPAWVRAIRTSPTRFRSRKGLNANKMDPKMHLFNVSSAVDDRRHGRPGPFCISRELHISGATAKEGHIPANNPSNHSFRFPRKLTSASVRTFTPPGSRPCPSSRCSGELRSVVSSAHKTVGSSARINSLW